MCGFVGFLGQPERLASEALEDIVGRMSEAVRHRGPDAGGTWADPLCGVALGHRRLAVLDLSPAGHQPMASRSGRYVVAYNGEIYNHLEIRREIDVAQATPASGSWRGRSDTETLLAAVEAFGVCAALRKFVGMFAFALWDRQDRVLYLARDRLGEKPLFYGWQGQTLLFGSTLAALKRHPAFRAPVERSALSAYLRHGYVPGPMSLYQDIHKLPAGMFIAVGPGGKRGCPQPYWAMREAAERGQAQRFEGSEWEAIDALDRLLRQSIAGQTVADVSVGAFLSGGLDSSTVVALMQAQSSRPVQTFTIGFDEPAFNEAEHAKTVARHLRTEHTELTVTSEAARTVIPRLPALYDEPLGDSAQIPNFLVSQLARQQVTVCLTGDGGDELLAGYNRYFRAMQFWSRMGGLPTGVRNALGSLLGVVPPHLWNALIRAARPLLSARHRDASPSDTVRAVSHFLRAKGPDDLFRFLVALWPDPARVARGAPEPPTLLNEPRQWPALSEPEHRMMFVDAMTYLPDDILVKVDRAAMGVALETRAPFLDHRVVEFCWSLPLSLKIRDGKGKWVLRKLLERYVPAELTDRPKMGFGVPVGSWIRGPLRDWAEELLDGQRLRREGYLNAAAVREKWELHLSGRHDFSHPLWAVLMFQAWQEAQ